MLRNNIVAFFLPSVYFYTIKRKISLFGFKNKCGNLNPEKYQLIQKI